MIPSPAGRFRTAPNNAMCIHLIHPIVLAPCFIILVVVMVGGGDGLLLPSLLFQLELSIVVEDERRKSNGEGLLMTTTTITRRRRRSRGVVMGNEGVEEDLLQCESLGRVPLEHMVDQVLGHITNSQAIALIHFHHLFNPTSGHHCKGRVIGGTVQRPPRDHTVL